MQMMIEERRTLKEWRKHRGLTQSELAEAVGRSLMTVSNWENGGQPKASDIAKIEQVLDINWSTDVVVPRVSS